MEVEASRLLWEEAECLIRVRDQREQRLRVSERHLDEELGGPDPEVMLWAEWELERLAQDGQQDSHYWK